MGRGGSSGNAGGGATFMQSLQRFDAFPKVNEDFFQRTLAGGVITLVATAVMLVLFVSEFGAYLAVRTDYQLTVDTSRGETMRINLDVTFPSMPCDVVSLDVMDVSGEQHLDVHHNIFKRRLSPSGAPIDRGRKEDVNGETNRVNPEERAEALARAKNATEARDEEDGFEGETEKMPGKCGSCYGAETTPEQCCDTCEQVREAYRLKGWAFSDPEGIEQCQREGFSEKLRARSGEGCNVYGYLEVNKVAGNFHFAPGKSFQHGGMHVHDLMPFKTKVFNMSHSIAKLSFGADFPGVVNPLDGVVRDMEGDAGMYQYFLRVVPTNYRDSRGDATATNQFSVTDHFKSVNAEEGQYLPGVFFFYELSPIKVELSESRRSFLHFLTSACAIVGGLFAVSGIVDATVYHGGRAIKKKIDLGKIS
jgi:hypothetical protein